MLPQSRLLPVLLPVGPFPLWPWLWLWPRLWLWLPWLPWFRLLWPWLLWPWLLWLWLLWLWLRLWPRLLLVGYRPVARPLEWFIFGRGWGPGAFIFAALCCLR